MQIKKSLRFLLISLCIMFVHNVGFGACPSSIDDSTLKTEVQLYDYYDTNSNAINNNEYAVRTCIYSGVARYVIQRCSKNDGYIILKTVYNSDRSKFGRVKFCVDGTHADDKGYNRDNTVSTGTSNTDDSVWLTCHGDGKALKFYDKPESGYIADITCESNVANKYIFSYNNAKSNTMYYQFHLDQYTDCSGDPISSPPYGPKTGDNYKYGVSSNSTACNVCTSDTIFEKGENDAPNQCKPCTEPGYGVSNNICALCTGGTFSKSNLNLNTAGGVVDIDNNTCEEARYCNEAIAQETNGGNVCRACTSGEVLYTLDNGNNVCLNKSGLGHENCTEEGYGLAQVGNTARCVFCSSVTASSTNSKPPLPFYKYDSDRDVNVCTICNSNTEPGSGFDEYFNGYKWKKSRDGWGYENADNEWKEINTFYDTLNAITYFPMKCEKCASNQVPIKGGNFYYKCTSSPTSQKCGAVTNVYYCHTCENGMIAGTGDESGQCVNCPDNKLFYDGECQICPEGTVFKDLGEDPSSNQPLGRNCVVCPNSLPSSDDRSECLCNTGVKQPGADYPTNPADFECKDECNPGWARYTVLDDGNFSNENTVCTKCDIYQSNYIKNGVEHPVCLTQTQCNSQDVAHGIKTEVENSITYTACVPCGADEVLKSDGTCGTGCDDYQVKENGACKSCSNGDIYDDATNRCIAASSCKTNEGDNIVKFIVKKEATNSNFIAVDAAGNEDDTVYFCHSCNEYEYRAIDINSSNPYIDQFCSKCENHEYYRNDISEIDGSRCQDCPDNFACNGKIKKKCPYGSVSSVPGLYVPTKKTGECYAREATNIQLGFLLYNSETNKYEAMSEEYYNNLTDESEIANFQYASCANLNAVPKEYNNRFTESGWNTESEYGDFTDTTGRADIFGGTSNKVAFVCEACPTGTVSLAGNCICGRGTDNKKYGLQVDENGNPGNRCIKCPNGRKEDNACNDDHPNHCTCNKCPEGMGYDPNEANGCKLCGKENASYGGLCKTKDELPESPAMYTQSVYFPPGGTGGLGYSADGFKWVECPAGSCCDNGNKYDCVKGTLSKVGEHCKPGTYNDKKAECLNSCSNGKTTEYTAIEIENWETAYCTIPVGVSDFCIGQYTQNSQTTPHMCFVPDKTKMPFETVMNIRNIDNSEKLSE